MEPSISLDRILSWVRDKDGACPRSFAHFPNILTRKDKLITKFYSKSSFLFDIQIFMEIPALQFHILNPIDKLLNTNRLYIFWDVATPVTLLWKTYLSW